MSAYVLVIRDCSSDGGSSDLIAPAIVKLGGALGRELRELELGIGLGKRVGDRLVRADRGAPDAAIVGIAARRLEREARQAVTHAGHHDPFGVEPGEGGFQPVAFGALPAVGGHADQIGRASFMETVCPYFYLSLLSLSFKTNFIYYL